MWVREDVVDPEKCDHDPKPVFDPEAAQGLSVHEIRQRWPRVRCKKCGTVQYESWQHYLMGDW